MSFHLLKIVEGDICKALGLMHSLIALQADLEEGKNVFEEGLAFTIQGLEHEVG